MGPATRKKHPFPPPPLCSTLSPLSPVPGRLVPYFGDICQSLMVRSEHFHDLQFRFLHNVNDSFVFLPKYHGDAKARYVSPLFLLPPRFPPS